MGILVDTSILIDLERSDIEVDLLFPGEELYLAAVSASELLHGVYRANSELRRKQRQDYVDAILTAIPILPFDLGVARVYAQVWADLVGSGLNIGAHDMQIAATALHYDMGVLTANVRHFSKIPDLRLV